MKEEKTIQRPWPVTVVCTLVFIAGLSIIVYAFTGAFAGFRLLYPAALVLCLIVMFAGLSGVWNMEKWGVWVFVTAVAFMLGLNLLVKAFQYTDLIWLLAAGILIYYLKRMK